MGFQREGGYFTDEDVPREKKISQYIYKYMRLGHAATFGFTVDERGFRVVYQVDSDLYLHVAIGTNGFIVTALLRNDEASNYDDFQY